MAFDPSMLILVVADHDTAVRIVHTLLRQLGCANVDDANNVAEALTKMRIKRYGLVISDWDTEPMTGCDFLRGVRCDPGLNRTPFIMTGESKSENVIAAKKAGVNSYIVKPFNAQMLKIKIEAALATKTTPPFRSGTAQQLSLSLRKSVKLKAPSRRPLPRPSD